MGKSKCRDFGPLNVGEGSTPEGRLYGTPHSDSITNPRLVLKPVEVDEVGALLDGRDRWNIAARLMGGWPKSRRG